MILSLRLGMVLSRNCTDNSLDYFREKYNLALLIKNNQSFSRQLMSDEILIEPTGRVDDSETGIGSYEYFTKDITGLFDDIKKRNERQYNFIIKEITEQRKHYKMDAIRWLEIIREMKLGYCFSKVGIFYFDGYVATEEVNFPAYERINCNVQDLCVEDLMKIKEYQIVFFV